MFRPTLPRLTTLLPLHAPLALLAALALCASGALLVACADEHDGHTHDVFADAPSDYKVDLRDPTCQDTAWKAPTCGPATVTSKDFPGVAQHIPLPTPITYTDSPPLAGDHRGDWAKWGEYEYLPPQRWLHNLEHGAVALLYHPCAPKAEIEALRAFAKARKPDGGGNFRWVLTPYPGLKSTLAAVTWGWGWHAPCFDQQSLEAFLADHYRKAPEDLGLEGGYDYRRVE